MNPLPPFEPFAAGDRRVSADVLNELVARVRALLVPEMGTLLDVGLDYPPQVFVARLTGAGIGADAGKYGFVEQRPAATASGYEDRPDGVVGTLAADPARPLWGTGAPGALVVMFPGWASAGSGSGSGSGSGPTLQRGWRFLGDETEIGEPVTGSGSGSGSGTGVYALWQIVRWSVSLQAWVTGEQVYVRDANA